MIYKNWNADLFQAIFLVEEGASPQEVDQANEDFGMPIGPFKVRDLSGVYLVLKKGEIGTFRSFPGIDDISIQYIQWNIFELEVKQYIQ